jgi:hypothetical protein
MNRAASPGGTTKAFYFRPGAGSTRRLVDDSQPPGVNKCCGRLTFLGVDRLNNKKMWT